MTLKSEPENVTQLVRFIVDQQLPVFANSIRNVFQATDSDNTTGQEIAEIILRDSALTSHVLAAANAANLGYGAHSKIVTVSRAVVVLGMNSLRSLCVSSAVVESVAGARHHPTQVREAISKAIHAAFQARDIGRAKGLKPADSERLFIEALLFYVGEIAFWCFGGIFALEAERRILEGVPASRVISDTLGKSFAQFGHELLQAWNLDFLICNSPEVAIANRLAAMKPGDCDEKKLKGIVTEISTIYAENIENTCSRIQKNTEEAGQMARLLGMNDLPLHPLELSADENLESVIEEPLPSLPSFPEPDLKLQLRVLSELGRIAKTRKDLPLILEACLEGIYRGVGLDRVVFCLFNADRSRMSVRMSVGHETQPLYELLNWPMNLQWLNFFDERKCCWLYEPGSVNESVILKNMCKIVRQESFWAVLSVDKRSIGIFYGDRYPSRRPLDQEAFDSFRQFVEQTEMIVRGLSG